MQTKKALKRLSNGNVVYDNKVSSTLLDRAEKYLADYDETDRQIVAKQNDVSINLPFVETIRRKVAKLVSGPDHAMPIVARFDLYFGLRRLAERSQNDVGLSRLAKQLEMAWHEDPLGVMTYGAVAKLIKQYKDTHPRSKAADAIEAECTRVGLHKLPVAKLVRLSAGISDQKDYEVAVKANGLDGNRPEQIRSRILIRELVALRGVQANSDEQVKDKRSAVERVTDRINKEAQGLDFLEKGEEPESEEVEKVEEVEEPEAKEEPEGEEPESEEVEKVEEVEEPESDEKVDEAVDLIEDVEQHIVEEAPPEAESYIEHEEEEGHSAPPGSAQWGAEEVLEEGHSAAPPTDEWIEEELEELKGLQDEMAGDGFELGSERVGVAPPGWESTVKKMKKHKEIDNPWKLAWFMKGKGAKPGKKSAQLSQPMQSAPMQPPGKPKVVVCPGCESMQPPGKPCTICKYPDPAQKGIEPVAKVAEKGKGIPLPKGKIKSQPEVTTYAPDPGKDGGNVLTASTVEDALLDGNVVKVGDVSIRITDSDDVELYNKDAGRACDITSLDTAISDFLAMVKEAEVEQEYRKLQAEYSVSKLMCVPCEKCGTLSLYPVAASTDDQYACECGNLTSAASVAELAKIAGGMEAYEVVVHSNLSPEDPRFRNQWHSITRALGDVAAGVTENVDDSGRKYLVGTIWNTDEQGVRGLESRLRGIGAEPMSKRVGQEKEEKKEEKKPGLSEEDTSFLMNLGAAKEAQLEEPMPPVEGPVVDMPPVEAPIEGMPGELGPAEVMPGLEEGLGAPVGQLSPEDVMHEFKMFKLSDPEGDLVDAVKSFDSKFRRIKDEAYNGKWPADISAAMASAVSQFFSGGIVASKKKAEMPLPKDVKPKEMKSNPGVKLPDPKLDPDLVQKELPVPGKPSTEHDMAKNKGVEIPDGKLAPDSETRAKMPNPGKPKAEHPPKDQKGTSLTPTDLGSDSELNEPFKSPKVSTDPQEHVKPKVDRK